MAKGKNHGFRACVGLTVVLGLGLGFWGCSKNPTLVGREAGARPRIEQLALSTAMEDAYGKVDFSFASGKQIFIRTKALSKTDVDFITSYVQKMILSAGGTPVVDESKAELELTNTIEVSGTDEVQKRKGLLVGQFKGTLSVLDLASGQVQSIYDLNSTVKTKRTKKAKTKVISN